MTLFFNMKIMMPACHLDVNTYTSLAMMNSKLNLPAVTKSPEDSLAMRNSQSSIDSLFMRNSKLPIGSLDMRSSISPIRGRMQVYFEDLEGYETSTTLKGRGFSLIGSSKVRNK